MHMIHSVNPSLQIGSQALTAQLLSTLTQKTSFKAPQKLIERLSSSVGRLVYLEKMIMLERVDSLDSSTSISTTLHTLTSYGHTYIYTSVYIHSDLPHIHR